jgi:hypothetical protein
MSVPSISAPESCIGFVLARGKSGFETFSAAEQTLGFFPTQTDAAAAVVQSSASFADAEKV